MIQIIKELKISLAIVNTIKSMEKEARKKSREFLKKEKEER